MTITREAFECLKECLYEADEIGCGIEVYSDSAPETFSSLLQQKGFTITRSPQMTEAELEREAGSIANYYIDDIEHPLTSVPNRVNAGLEIINLAKKYRGTL